jgi:hypothetical protein
MLLITLIETTLAIGSFAASMYNRGCRAPF